MAETSIAMGLSTYTGRIGICRVSSKWRSIQVTSWERPTAKAGASLAFSPDGTRVALGSVALSVQVWDANTRRPLLEPSLATRRQAMPRRVATRRKPPRRRRRAARSKCAQGACLAESLARPSARNLSDNDHRCGSAAVGASLVRQASRLRAASFTPHCFARFVTLSQRELF